MGRKLLWAGLVLAPITFLLRYVVHVGDTTLLVVAAAALIPLAWLIGEATEHAGEHTGPGIGGYLYAWAPPAPYLASATLLAVSLLSMLMVGPIMRSISAWTMPSSGPVGPKA